MSICNTKKWRDFSKRFTNESGARCENCYASNLEDEKILQVHHKFYIDGRKPWEYDSSELEVLCKGCHSKVHDILDNNQWHYAGECDRQDLIGDCDACGRKIRYEHYAEHAHFGHITLGKYCAEKTLENRLASDIASSWYVNEKNHKLSAFVNSSKWRQIDDNKFVRKVKFTMSREFNAIIVIESIGEKAFFTNVMLSNETYNFNYISNKLNDFITAKKISFLLNSFLLGLPKKRGWELINSDNYAYRFVLVRNLHKFKVVKSSRHIGKWWLR